MRKILSLLAVLVLCSVLAFAQTRVVTGQVKDEVGEPVPFSSVTIKGSNRGTTTDASGNFRIEAASGDILVISAVGLTPREFTVGSANTYNVSLLKSGNLQEVVVTTALGVKKRPKEIGYANATVQAEQLTNGKSPQLAQALSGKVSGLTITNANNSVNPAVKVTLRGFRSMTGNNDALIVLDGVPVPQNALSYINPNDIADVTVLKGGQAATLYGSDGVNGAILINTKKGSRGKPLISFNSTLNFERLSFLPDFQDTYGSGSDYGGLTPAGNYRTYENQQYGDRYDGSIRPLGRVAESGDTFNFPYKAIPGERRRVWNTGFTNTNDIAVSGGDATSRFYLSFQDANTHGIVPKDRNRRDQLRFSATKEFGKFTASFTGNYILEKIEQTSANFYFDILNQAAHIPISKLKDWKNNQFANPNGYFNDYYNNPFFNLDNNRDLQQNNYFNGNMELNFKPFEWLGFTERIGVATTNAYRRFTTGKFLYSTYAKNDAYVPAPFPNDYDGIDRAGGDILGSVLDRSNFGQRINNDLFLTAQKDFKDFSTSLILGQNIQVRRSKNIDVSSASIVIPELYNVSNRTGELGGGASNTEQRKYGYYGDLTLGFREFLYLHASARLDGTSVFYLPGRKKSLYQYPYYGADISFIVSDAFQGMKSDMLNYLKLRAGYNKNGNDNLSPYRLAPDFPLGGGFPYGTTAGSTVGDVFPDPNLKPEFVTSYEAGLEANVWNNRINLDFSIYTQKSEDQVLSVSLPPSTGYPAALINVGESKNWGYEADIRAAIFRTQNLTWEISARYSNNDNKVISLFGGLTRLAAYGGGFTYAQTSAEVGKPFPYLFGTAYVRDSASGRVVVNSNDGYPQRTSNLKEFGRTIPKHQLGLGTTLRFKGFSFGANAEYRGGHVIYHDLGRTMAFTGSSKVTTQYDRQPFVWPNSTYTDGTGKFVPNTTVATRNGHYTAWVTHFRQIAENFVTSGAFWKLRDVSLAYTLPSGILSRTKIIKSATIGIYGRNLITLLPDGNVYTDPEFSTTTGNGLGINADFITPPVRAFGATLSINF